MYYPVRHHLVQHMISAMQRLGFTPSVTIEQRKLAVDLAEVVIKWELQRIKDQQVNVESLTLVSVNKDALMFKEETSLCKLSKFTTVVNFKFFSNYLICRCT